MAKSISEVLKEASARRSIPERAEVLRNNDSECLRGVIFCAFVNGVLWDIPEGAPPYKPSILVDNHDKLPQEWKKMYTFLKDGYPGLKQLKRETMFVQLLEAVTPDDAVLIVAVKDKTLDKLYPRLTRAVMDKAFPGLLPLVPVEEKIDG